MSYEEGSKTSNGIDTRTKDELPQGDGEGRQSQRVGDVAVDGGGGRRGHGPPRVSFPERIQANGKGALGHHDEKIRCEECSGEGGGR